jgi:hypothetical protein
MFRRFGDLLLVGVGAGVASALTLCGARTTALQIVVVLPFVLFLPGYALTAALFPGPNLGRAERLALSLGLSLAVTTLNGLVLDRTSWGLQADAWAISLGGVTWVAGLVGFLRRRANQDATLKWRQTGLSVYHLLLFGLAALLVSGALLLARAGALGQQKPSFTQLWILPGEGAGSNVVRIGMHSAESSPERYRLQVEMAGRIIFERPSIGLGPGQTWEETVALPAEQTGNERVEARIYLLGSPDEVYRQVWLRGEPQGDSVNLESLGPGE